MKSLFYLVSLLLIVSCITNPEINQHKQIGNLEISYNFLESGSLSKINSDKKSNLRYMSLLLVAEGEDSLYKIIKITGSNPIPTLFSNISPKIWSIQIKTFDYNDSIIHQGIYSVKVGKADTTKLDISLESRFSFLRGFLDPVPSESNRLQVLVRGQLILDTVYLPGSLQTTGIKINYNYLPASPNGESSIIEFLFTGESGDSTISYQGSIEVLVLSGKNQNMQLVLKRFTNLIRKTDLKIKPFLENQGTVKITLITPEQQNDTGVWLIRQKQLTSPRISEGYMYLYIKDQEIVGRVDWNNEWANGTIKGTILGNKASFYMVLNDLPRTTGLYHSTVSLSDSGLVFLDGFGRNVNFPDSAQWTATPIPSKKIRPELLIAE